MDSSLELCRLSTSNVISVDFLTKLGNAENSEPIITSFGRWFGCNTETKNRILCIRWIKESPTTFDLMSYIAPRDTLIQQRYIDQSVLCSNVLPNPKPRFITHIDIHDEAATSSIKQQIRNWCRYEVATMQDNLNIIALLSPMKYLKLKAMSDVFSLLSYKKRGFMMSFRTFNQKKTVDAKPYNTDHEQTDYDVVNWTDVHWGNDKNGFINEGAKSTASETVDFGMLFDCKAVTKRCIDYKLFLQVKCNPYFNSKSYYEYGYIIIKLVTVETDKPITAYKIKKAHDNKSILFYKFYDASENLQFLVFITGAFQQQIEKGPISNPFILSRYYTLDEDAIHGVVFVGDPRKTKLRTFFVFPFYRRVNENNSHFLKHMCENGNYTVPVDKVLCDIFDDSFSKNTQNETSIDLLRLTTETTTTTNDTSATILDKVNETKQRLHCQLCYKIPCDSLILPCYHFFACHICLDNVTKKKCPLCSVTFEKVIRIL